MTRLSDGGPAGGLEAPEPSPKRAVFIIDDEESDRARLSAILGARHYRVQLFESGRHFLDQTVDLNNACILLDVWMPEIDGLTVVNHLREQSPQTPVIMLSGKSTLSIAVEAMKRGAVDFLEKPVAEESLVQAVERAFSLRPSGPASSLSRDELLQKVTRREGQVLELLVQGHPNKVVAHRLGIAENTVEVHRQRLMKRLGVKTFAELVRLAVRSGI